MLENTKKYQSDIKLLLNNHSKLHSNNSKVQNTPKSNLSTDDHSKLSKLINPIAQKLPLFEIQLLSNPSNPDKIRAPS